VIWNNDTIRELERASIRQFVGECRALLAGRVLDFGAGKPETCREPQPYRDLVSGYYVPYEPGDEHLLDCRSFAAVLCTQVLQYVADPLATLLLIGNCLTTNGHLVMTYPTCWDEVEATDLWRFTKAGMEKLLNRAGFRVLVHQRRAEIALGGFCFPLGYGVVACRE
jgi:SAM-dependent methyltransferase